jgi:hypothetical protein
LIQTRLIFKGKLFRAATTDAIKYGPPEIHLETSAPASPLGKSLIQKDVECFGIRAGEIRHPAAIAAYHMGMRCYIAVKPFLPINNPQGNHQPFLLKKIDVPVYRTQGKIGDRRFKLVIYPLSAGMGHRGPDNFQNGIPFFAVLPLDIIHISIIITIIIIVKKISYRIPIFIFPAMENTTPAIIDKTGCVNRAGFNREF